MSQFPSNSNLYLDDDVVVSAKGLREPGKEKLLKLTKKIITAWQNEEFEQLPELLFQYESLRGSLSPEFEGFQKLLPTRRYIQQLQRAKRSSETLLQSGTFAKAHACLTVLAPDLTQVSSEDQCTINLLLSALKQLRRKIEPAWINSEKEAIDKLISLGTEDSLKKARERLGALEKSPLPQRELLAAHDELLPKINAAGRRRRIEQMNQAFNSRSWQSAVELSQELLRLDSSCAEAKDVLRKAASAIRNRRLIFAGVACLVILVGMGAVKMHRDQMRAGFWSALTAGQYDVALRQAQLTQTYDERSAAYIQFLARMKECENKQTFAAEIPQVESAQLWGHWRQIVSAVGQAAWVKDPQSTTDNLREAKAYYDGLLTVYSQVYPVLKECQDKKKRAGKILDVRSDTQWSHWQQEVLAASTNWMHGRPAPQVIDNLREANAYYTALLNKAVTLSLEVYPKDAKVVIMRGVGTSNIVLTASECATLFVFPDNYHIKADCENYQPGSIVTIKEGLSRRDTNRFILALQPLDGILVVNSAVRAEVWCAGVKLGTTGEQIPLPAEKTHSLEIKALGYKTETIRLRLSAKEALTRQVDLRLPTGILRVGVSAKDQVFTRFLPTNGVLYVDASEGVNVTFPHHMELLPGRHEVKLTAPGFESSGRKIIQTEIDETSRVSFELSPVDSSVVFTTDLKSERAKIYELKNGKTKFLGYEGEQIYLSPFVKHAVQLESKGYKTGYWDVTLPIPGKRHPDLSVKMYKAGEYSDKSIPVTPPKGGKSVEQMPGAAPLPPSALPVECTTCNGRGCVTCTYCRGQGFTQQTCSMCNGQDLTRQTCSMCNGQDLTRQTCSMCNGQDLTRQTCSMCNGQDLTRQMCTYCSGTGVSQGSRCIMCSGTGKNDRCVYCSGTGKKDRCVYCSGTGKKDRCVYCSGTGKKDRCVYCSGTGITGEKIKCSTCRGLGTRVCSACQGSGKRR